jgi:hypothetical protein
MAEETRTDRVILISMMKSGTHLITELLAALGYRMYGHVRVNEKTRPVLDAEARRRMATMVYDDDTLLDLKSQPEDVFDDAAGKAWEALAWSWQLRFGMPLVSWYSDELVNTGLVEQARRRTAGSSFTETPPGICWVLHDFDVRRIDGAFLREWAETGEPRIIFNYRDPRDTILSMVNFLCGRTKEGLSAFNNLRAFSGTLMAMDGIEERLTYALTDEAFPCQADDFKRMLWLLHHPDVCKASFEELVGPSGGGSADAQLAAVTRLMDFLGITTTSPRDIAGTLFNRDAFSFYRGQIGTWREVFTPEHHRLAQSRLGEVLPLYGYR